MFRRVLPVAVLISALTAACGRAEKATFENFPEGARGTSFTDAMSGITFSNSNIGGFATDYSTATVGRPRTSPGNMLVGPGFVIGNSSTQSRDFAFTMTMPQPINHLSMDLVGVALGPNTSLQLNLYNASGTLLDSQKFPFAEATFAETNVSLARTTADVASVRVAGVGSGTYTAYDNIIITVPEPTDGVFVPLALAATGGGLVMLRRGREFR